MIKLLGLVILILQLVACEPEEEIFDLEEYLINSGMSDVGLIGCLTSNYEISSINELEELTSLQCDNMGINSISDIGILSGLENLYLSHNNISTIEFNEEINLKRLIVDYENNLANVSIINLPNIYSINLQNVSLEYLEISNNSQLSRIILESMSAETIEITDSDDLYEITIDSITASNFNLNHNHKLTLFQPRNSNLAQVSINNMDLLHGIDNNTDTIISELYVVNLPALFLVDLIGSQLNHIELNNTPRLLTLNLSNNNIISIDLDNINLDNHYDFDIAGSIYHCLVNLLENPLTIESQDYLQSINDFYIEF